MWGLLVTAVLLSTAPYPSVSMTNEPHVGILVTTAATAHAQAQLIVYSPDGTQWISARRTVHRDGEVTIKIPRAFRQQIGNYTAYVTVSQNDEAFGLSTNFTVTTPLLAASPIRRVEASAALLSTASFPTDPAAITARCTRICAQCIALGSQCDGVGCQARCEVIVAYHYAHLSTQ